jgi:hypothetical protein
MNRAARVISLALGLVIGAGTIAPVAAAARAPEHRVSSPIVLAQLDPQAERRERKGIFRFLFRNRENRQRQEATPRREMRLVPRREREAAPARGEEPRRQTRRKRQADAEKPRANKPRADKKSADRSGGNKQSADQQSAEKPRKERKQRKSRPRPVAVPEEAKVVEKAPDAKRVVVMGDFLGGALAKGLTEAFAQNANVVVVDASKGDSGLVRADNYDWTAQVPTLMTEQKPDAILMMIGANDRQSISSEGGSSELGSDAWRLAYLTRVSALADVLKATAKPVLWAGLAPVKSSAMSRDYSTLNGIIREQLEVRGMRYVDVWNGFADETGKYIGTGPDMNGQSVQLRDSDGVNFTRAGQRKLAFFVERELTELLGSPQPLLASTAPAEPTNLEPADQPARIGPMIPLDALAVAGDALSAGPAPADPGQGAIATTISSRLSGSGPVSPPPGRADDFAWPARPLAARRRRRHRSLERRMELRDPAPPGLPRLWFLSRLSPRPSRSPSRLEIPADHQG